VTKPTLESILKNLPPETQEVIRAMWQGVPADQRGDLTALLRYVPKDPGSLRTLLDLSKNQIRQAFGRKHSVAIIGPTNTGKSTLYNQFVQDKGEKALVSPVPGTTRVPSQADAGLFAVVDTPGADAVGAAGETERQLALDAAAAADILVILFDAVQGIKQTELDLFDQLAALDKPYIVALNKIDLVRRERSEVVRQVAGTLGLETEQVIPISAKNGENLGALVTGIAVAEPALVSALGQALPQYRWQLAWRSIISSASIAAAIALTPLPVIDFAPLVITQSVMVLGIARIYDYQITLERARELVVTFGLGFIGRMLFAQLSKLGGVPGWLLASAVASSLTVAMGVAAAVWFERGERLSRETLSRLTRELTGQLLDTLKSLGSRRPTRKTLRERIETALEETDLGKELPGAQLPDGTAGKP